MVGYKDNILDVLFCPQRSNVGCFFLKSNYRFGSVHFFGIALMALLLLRAKKRKKRWLWDNWTPGESVLYQLGIGSRPPAEDGWMDGWTVLFPKWKSFHSTVPIQNTVSTKYTNRHCQYMQTTQMDGWIDCLNSKG